MNEVATAAVQQVCDLAFYKRRDRWVDSRLVANPAEVQPERVIAFGSRGVPRPRGQAGAARAGKGASPSAGDILMLVDGRPVLIKAPADQP